MRDFLLCIAGHSALANSEGKRKMKKEKKKKSEEKKGENKNGSGLPLAGKGMCCSHRPIIRALHLLV